MFKCWIDASRILTILQFRSFQLAFKSFKFLESLSFPQGMDRNWFELGAKLLKEVLNIKNFWVMSLKYPGSSRPNHLLQISGKSVEFVNYLKNLLFLFCFVIFPWFGCKLHLLEQQEEFFIFLNLIGKFIIKSNIIRIYSLWINQV